MKIKLPFQLSEYDYVIGIQAGNPAMERKFYDYCVRYFHQSKGTVFHDAPDASDDFFHEAFIQIWTEIQNGRIYTVDKVIFRKKADGKAEKMTAKLTSFMMTIVRNQYMKTKRHISVDIDNAGKADLMKIEELLNFDDADKEIKHRVVDDCISDLPSRCKEILTLFYFKKKSLDEILTIRKDNSSKDGLKTAKSKCMRQLEGRIVDNFKKYNIYL